MASSIRTPSQVPLFCAFPALTTVKESLVLGLSVGTERLSVQDDFAAMVNFLDERVESEIVRWAVRSLDHSFPRAPLIPVSLDRTLKKKLCTLPYCNAENEQPGSTCFITQSRWGGNYKRRSDRR
jgi:hypothetical protein